MTEARVICIQGPTASGKSAVADRLAHLIEGEVVSADSMQVYRGMDIGTAKVPVEQRSVPYHCLDLVDPGEPYSAALFQRGSVPVLCGGTGFYVRAALDDLEFASGAQEHNAVRERFELLYEREGAERVHEELAAVDPESAALIHPHNVKRVIRALEMHEAGESYARRKLAFKTVPPRYPNVRIALNVERSELYRRIGERVDRMFEDGLVDEVEQLLAGGFRSGLTAPQAIGYKEVVTALEGACTLDEARSQIAQATRRYAKRQLSWLRGQKGTVWIEATGRSADELVAETLETVARHQSARGATAVQGE